ncbi:MAG: hypothetical protein LBC71_05605 [Oscillospiraceae bacterium]|nr:hypothetical protein [Oscillospiraceae bacterium]
MRQNFERIIDNLLKNMTGDYIDLVSGDIHRAVGGYPSKNHRMPICCEVMYSRMRSNDIILYAPPKGKGATLKIRYYNPNISKSVCTRQYNEDVKTKNNDASVFWMNIISILTNTPRNIQTIDKNGNSDGGKWFLASVDRYQIKIDESQKQPSSKLANSRLIQKEEFIMIYSNYFKWRTGVISREIAKGDSLNSSYIFAIINAFLAT